MENRFLLLVYREYLIQVASREGRPFRLPTTTNTLRDRADYRMFAALAHRLEDKEIDSVKKIKKFMAVAERVTVNSFHVSEIIGNFDNLLEHYRNEKEETVDDKKLVIKKAFDYLEEYCIMNELSYDDLFKGSPPVILKIWKEGNISDEVLLFMFDINIMKKKTWYKIYCGNLISKAKHVLESINSNVYLYSFMECEQLKLKNSICGMQI